MPWTHPLENSNNRRTTPSPGHFFGSAHHLDWPELAIEMFLMLQNKTPSHGQSL